MRVMMGTIFSLVTAFLASTTNAQEEFAEKPNSWIVGEVRAFTFVPYETTDGHYDVSKPTQACKDLGNVGWMVADGRSLPIQHFGVLAKRFALPTGGSLWGTTIEQVTFRIPDLRGRFLRGAEFQGGDDLDQPAPGRDPGQRNAEIKGATFGVGTYEEEDFARHRHFTREVPVVVTHIGDFVADVRANQPFGGDSQSHAGGSETRPDNVAVSYWIYVGRRVDLNDGRKC